MGDNSATTDKKASVFIRFKNVLKAVTIEPVVFLMWTGMILSSTTIQTLALEKACRVDLQLPKEACDALRSQDSDNNTESEKIVQEYVSSYISYKSIITAVLPCLLLIFAGGWMDLTGRRKVLMLLPVMGQILYDTNNIINVVFFDQLNATVLIFSESIILSIFGGWSVLCLAAFCFINDITTETNRTHRLGLVTFGLYIGMPVGVLLSGILLKHFGYLCVFITAVTMACVNGSYIMFNLRDPPRTREQKMHDNRGFIYFMKTFFSPAHFINSLKVVFNKTTKNRRIVLCILIATSILVLGPVFGESSVMYLTTRYRFSWDEFQFSIFQAFNMIVTTIGNMIAILLLSKKLGWHDAVLGIISMTSKIGASFLYCFAPTGLVFFMGPLVDMLNGTATIALRSILSKTVNREEISRLNSIFSISEVLSPMAFVPLYVQVYTHTMDIMPGLVFLLSAGISVLPLIVYLWLFYRHRSSIRKFKDNKSVSELEQLEN